MKPKQHLKEGSGKRSEINASRSRSFFNTNFDDLGVGGTVVACVPSWVRSTEPLIPLASNSSRIPLP